MNALAKYVKPTTTAKVVTSVAVEVTQLNFVQENNLNLSQITRDAINKLMKKTKD